MPKDSILTHVVTFDIAKHFIILLETLFFLKKFTFSAHEAAETVE